MIDDPTGYGRVVRASDRRVLRIVEQRDATPDELDIKESNMGVYAFRRDLLGPALRNLTTNNSQSEFYLTDVIGGLAAMGHRVGAVQAPAGETQGVNDRWQLALAEREFRNRTNRHWLLNGVTMLDPRQTFIDVTVKLGRDVTIYPGTILQGETVVGDGTDLGPTPSSPTASSAATAPCATRSGVDAEIGDGATVGPFAHLPAGSTVAAGAVDRSVLHCKYRRLIRPAVDHTPGEGRPHGEGHHQEARSLLGANAPGAGGGGGHPPRVSRSATPTSSSSPTARSGRDSPRACAAATCS